MKTSLVPRGVATRLVALAFLGLLPALFYNLVSAATFPTWFWLPALANTLDVPILLVWIAVEISLWAVVYFYVAAVISRWITRAQSRVGRAIRLSSVLASTLGITALPIYCGTGIGVALRCQTYWSLVRELLAK
jgi:hypothetical protein